MQKSGKNKFAFILLSMAASVCLAYFGVGTFIFTLPLLLLDRRIEKTFNYVLIQAITYAGVMVAILLPYRGFFENPYWGSIAFSTIFPLSAALESLIYTGMREKSNSVLRKLVAGSIPAFVLGCAFSVWLSSPVGKESFETLSGAIRQIITTQSFGFDMSKIADKVLPLMLLVCTPVAMILGSLPILIMEFVQNSYDEDWQYNMANMKLPKTYVWTFFASVVLVVAGLAFKQIPSYIAVIGWNVSLGFGLHYMMNGYSVLLSYFRKRNTYISAARVFILIVVVFFIPGFSTVVLTCLSVMGVLENWVKLR